MSSLRIKGSGSNCVSLVSSGLSWEIKTRFIPVIGIRLFQENGSLSIPPEDLIIYYFCQCLEYLKLFLLVTKKCIMEIDIESSPPEI